jgi:HEAT repeat protein
LIEEPWAVELLEKAALKDEQPAVQTAAAEALQIQKSGAANSTWQAPRPGEQAWLVRWAVAQGRMVPVGDEAMPEVMDALENNDPAIRREAALTLGVFADPDSMSPLVQAYADPERSVRDAAFESLCHLSRAWGLDDDLSFSGGLSPA